MLERSMDETNGGGTLPSGSGTRTSGGGEPAPASPPLADARADASGDDSALANSEPQVAASPALSEDQVKMALRKVKDPELNLNIIDLGLVYEIMVDGND